MENKSTYLYEVICEPIANNCGSNEVILANMNMGETSAAQIEAQIILD